jgi:hypothetical protein
LGWLNRTGLEPGRTWSWQDHQLYCSSVTGFGFICPHATQSWPKQAEQGQGHDKPGDDFDDNDGQFKTVFIGENTSPH